LHFKDGMKYSEKIIKVAQEPVAYCLYKKRQFNSLKYDTSSDNALAEKNDFRNHLLACANAKLTNKAKLMAWV